MMVYDVFMAIIISFMARGRPRPIFRAYFMLLCSFLWCGYNDIGCATRG